LERAESHLELNWVSMGGGGFPSLTIDFFVINLLAESAHCVGALLCWRNQLLDQVLDILCALLCIVMFVPL
jgi:hypothetical protein